MFNMALVDSRADFESRTLKWGDFVQPYQIMYIPLSYILSTLLLKPLVPELRQQHLTFVSTKSY